MKMRAALWFSGAVIGSVVLLSSAAYGATEDNKGLTVTPLRSHIDVRAGKSATGTFTVSNLTATTVKVDLSIEKFSVKNGTYEYQFGATNNAWVQLRGEKQVEIQPGKEYQVAYQVQTPDYAPSGGYYYALLASMNVPGSTISSELRVASLLYLVVDGGALMRISSIEEAALPPITMSPVINYEYEASNTGNVHLSTADYNRVKGFLVNKESGDGASLLMPKTQRTLSGKATLPWLPGVYEVTYGFKNEQGGATTKSATVVYVPLWSLIVLFFAILASVTGLRRLRAHRRRNVV